jgi:hypothetical protein
LFGIGGGFVIVPALIYVTGTSIHRAVATSLLARQLGWQNDEHLLVADTPDEFAKAVTRLHGNAKLWAKIRAGALGRVAQDCDPAVFAAALRGALGTAPTVW